MTSLRPVLAIGASLFVLAGASLLDVARMEPLQIAAAKGDRQDIAFNDCGSTSLIAACASSHQGSMATFKPVVLVQAYDDKPTETTLVQVRLGQ